MNDPLLVITLTLFIALYIGAIALYVIEFWKCLPSHQKIPYSASAVLYWSTVHPLILFVVVTQFGSYKDSAWLVIIALNLPTILSIILMAVNQIFRDYVRRLSLKFLIEDVEAIPRVMVGTLFLVWWQQGRLPSYFAFVAGPGDILSGIFAGVASQFVLKPMFKDGAKTANDIIETVVPTLRTPEEAQALLRRTHWAMGLVLFGIADFIAAPASSLWSMRKGESPEALAEIPLAMVPIMLVPTIFVLEVWAMFQMWRLRTALIMKEEELTKEQE